MCCQNQLVSARPPFGRQRKSENGQKNANIEMAIYWLGATCWTLCLFHNRNNHRIDGIVGRAGRPLCSVDHLWLLNDNFAAIRQRREENLTGSLFGIIRRWPSSRLRGGNYDSSRRSRSTGRDGDGCFCCRCCCRRGTWCRHFWLVNRHSRIIALGSHSEKG